MIVEVLESLLVLRQTLFQPDAILWTQLVQRLLEGNSVGLTHKSSVPTYGAPDLGSPHGRMVSDAALGKLPMYFAGAAMEVVGIHDAARAFLLAAERGRVGERYIVSERTMSWKELVTIAADAVGRRPPRIGVPIGVMKVIGLAGEGFARLLRRDVVMTRHSVRLMHLMPPLDHTKATRDLGWEPAPTAIAIADAARFYVTRDSRERSSA